MSSLFPSLKCTRPSERLGLTSPLLQLLLNVNSSVRFKSQEQRSQSEQNLSTITKTHEKMKAEVRGLFVFRYYCRHDERIRFHSTIVFQLEITPDEFEIFLEFFLRAKVYLQHLRKGSRLAIRNFLFDQKITVSLLLLVILICPLSFALCLEEHEKFLPEIRKQQTLYSVKSSLSFILLQIFNLSVITF